MFTYPIFCHSTLTNDEENSNRYKRSQNIRTNSSISNRLTMVTLSLILISYLNFLVADVTTTEQLLDPTKYLIGVPPTRRNYYDLTSENTFKCLDGSGSIPREFVNDDYCDCSDASDEPGTSACPHGRFYCINEGYIQSWIPSAWVNDGQCDCCDTSDEYNSSASCENTCGVLGELHRRTIEEHRAIADQGSAIRSQYKEQARQRKEQNSQLLEQYRRELSEKENAIKKLEEELNSDFGPSNVFFPLKGKCYSYNDHEYTYTLCPFERAAQESTSGMQTELGRWAGWAGSSDNLYSKQKYEGGIQCWNGPARSALINIACGVEDKITSVTEPAKCEYVYDFITPAACPDTDPPEEESTPDPNEQVVTPPSFEVEEDPDSNSYSNDEANDAPDLETPPTQDGEKHDEL